MVNDNPKGWGWNPSVITLCLVVLSMAVAVAYYMGARDNEAKNILERLKVAEAKAAKAENLGSYKAGGIDALKGHNNPEDEKENK